MERATNLAELLLSEPEILTWLDVNPEHRHEQPLFQSEHMSAAPELVRESFPNAVSAEAA